MPEACRRWPYRPRFVVHSTAGRLAVRGGGLTDVPTMTA
jgi:hypothetical protein